MENKVVAVLLNQVRKIRIKFPQVICVNKGLEEICRLAFTGVLDFEKRDDSNSPISNFRQKSKLPIQRATYY